MFKRKYLPGAIVAALTLCSVPAFATETCYDLSRLTVGSSYHIGDEIEFDLGKVRVRNFIKDGAVFTPVNPIDQHFEVAHSAIARGVLPEGEVIFVSMQIIPDNPVQEITLKVAQQLGITGELPALVEINGELHDFEGSFNVADSRLFGNFLTGRARFRSDLVQDAPGPNGPSYWHRGLIRARALPGDSIQTFAFGAQIMRFDDVCIVE